MINIRSVLILNQALLVTTAILCASVTRVALAQDEAALEEVVVTAQRREQSIQDTPIAVTALSGDQLEDKFVSTLVDLQDFAPGLQIESSQLGNLNIRIRAVGAANDDITTDSSVGVFVDDIFISRDSSSTIALYELERVEVLRGPQGTLFGKNTAGGAIRYVTLKPSEDFWSKVSFDIGDEGTLNAKAVINGALSDRVYGQAAVLSMNRDPLMLSTVGARGGNDTNIQGARVSLRALPADDLELLFTMDAQQLDQASRLYSIGPNDGFQLRGFTPAVDASNPVRSSVSGDTGFENLDIFGLMGRADWSLSGTTVSLIAGYRSHELESDYDIDQTPVRIVQEFLIEESDVTSLELHVNGTSDDTRLNWDGGIYYFNEDGRAPKGFDLGGLGLGLNSWTQNIDTDSYAVYGQATYAVTDRFRITGGLRYTRDEKSYSLVALSDSPGMGNPLIEENYTFSASNDWTETTPKLGFDFDVGEDSLLYLSFANGYKAGGFEGTPPSVLVAQAGGFDPENVDTLEFGLKSRFADGRAQINVAAFASDFENIQVSVVTDEGNPITTNAAEADITGIELEGQFRPTANFDLRFTYALLNPEYKQFLEPDAAGTVPCSAVGDLCIDRSGLRIPDNPENTYSLSAQYTFPAASFGTFSLGADVFHADDAVDFDGFANPRAYDVAHARLDLVSASENWEAALWVRNLTDELYYRGSAPGVTQAIDSFARSLEPPRIAGVTFTYYWR